MSFNITLIGQMITFTLLVWFTMKYIWPPLINALEERKKRIADGLAAADKGQESMRLAGKKAIGVLKDAKEQSSEIVNQAQKRAGEIVEESKDTAKKEGDRLIIAANARIDQELQQARESLRTEVAALVIDAAEKILGAEIDKAKHQNIMNSISNQLG